jgi:hypothetical protein
MSEKGTPKERRSSACEPPATAQTTGLNARSLFGQCRRRLNTAIVVDLLDGFPFPSGGTSRIGRRRSQVRVSESISFA